LKPPPRLRISPPLKTPHPSFKNPIKEHLKKAQEVEIGDVPTKNPAEADSPSRFSEILKVDNHRGENLLLFRHILGF